MKAVILAAGQGKRMRPLTHKTPKPLLMVNGKPILDYILESFPKEIDEVVIVVKHLGHQIIDYVGDKNRHMRIRYAQGSFRGTAHSFLAAKKFLKDERFLVAQGDDIPNPQDIKNCLAKNFSILVYQPRDPKACGMAYLKPDGTIKKIIEKPKKTKSQIAVTGVMVLNTNIFNYQPDNVAGEYYFSSMVSRFARDHKVHPVKATGFIGEITTPVDIPRAKRVLMSV